MREKWFIRSRRLAAAAMPLVVAVGALFDLDPAELSDQLARLGTEADRFVTAALSLWAAVAATWTWLRPDDARLRPLPKLPSGGGGAGPLGFVGLVAGVLLLACVSSPPVLRGGHSAERAWVAALEAYNAALERDNAYVRACLEVAPPDECDPAIDAEARARALEVIERGNALLDELARLEAEPETNAARIDAILAHLERLALELAIREAHR